MTGEFAYASLAESGIELATDQPGTYTLFVGPSHDGLTLNSHQLTALRAFLNNEQVISLIASGY
jgi:hypothetical protein